MNFTITVSERKDDAVDAPEPLDPPPPGAPICALLNDTPRLAAACQFWLLLATSVWLTDLSYTQLPTPGPSVVEIFGPPNICSNSDWVVFPRVTVDVTAP